MLDGIGKNKFILAFINYALKFHQMDELKVLCSMYHWQFEQKHAVFRSVLCALF